MMANGNAKLGSKAGVLMLWSAVVSSSKRLSACVTLSPVGDVSQQMRRDDGVKQGTRRVVEQWRRRYSVSRIEWQEFCRGAKVGYAGSLLCNQAMSCSVRMPSDGRNG